MYTGTVYGWVMVLSKNDISCAALLNQTSVSASWTFALKWFHACQWRSFSKRDFMWLTALPLCFVCGLCHVRFRLQLQERPQTVKSINEKSKRSADVVIFPCQTSLSHVHRLLNSHWNILSFSVFLNSCCCFCFLFLLPLLWPVRLM